MSDVTPAQAAAALAGDPDVRAVAEVLAAEALTYLAHPDHFGKFRRSCLESWPDDRDWLADMQPAVLATFAEVLAPGGPS